MAEGKRIPWVSWRLASRNEVGRADRNLLQELRGGEREAGIVGFSSHGWVNSIRSSTDIYMYDRLGVGASGAYQCGERTGSCYSWLFKIMHNRSSFETNDKGSSKKKESIASASRVVPFELNPNPATNSFRSALALRLNLELGAERGVVDFQEPITSTPEPAFGDLRNTNGTTFVCAGTARA